MKSNSERETISSPIKVFWLFFLLAIIILNTAIPRSAFAVGSLVSLTELARLEADDHPDASDTLPLVHGYLALGLGTEAASLLERRVRLGELPRDAATYLFEKIVTEQSQWDDPGRIVAICETAARNGLGSALLAYSYGTALRMTGRPADASKILAQIGPESPYQPYALLALGQISVERGDVGTGLDIFKRVAEIGEASPGSPVSVRARRAQAELLVVMGRAAEARPLLDGLPPENPDYPRRVGAAMAADDPAQALENLPAELIAGQPVRRRALFLLLKGGLARDQGRFASAVSDLSRAEEELKSSLSTESSSASGISHRRGIAKTLEMLIEAQGVARQGLVSRAPGDDNAAARDDAVELLVDLLFLDHSVLQAMAATPPIRPPSADDALTTANVDQILKRIERIVLEGMEESMTAVRGETGFRDVDAFVKEFDGQIDVLQNLGHPIHRYRLLLRLEKSQAEIHRLRERIRQRREAAIADIETGGKTTIPGLLRDVGLYLKELDAIRDAMGEAREVTRTNFRLLRHRNESEGGSRTALDEAVKDTLALSDDWMAARLPSIRGLEDRARNAFLEQEKQDLAALRPIILRQLADALVAQARSLRRSPRPEAQRESWTAIEKSAAILAEGGLGQADRFDTAIHIGSLIVGGQGRWEALPGRYAGERERKLISSVLPVLEASARTEARREESLYLIATLRMFAGEDGAQSAAKSFLEKFPSSPLSGEIAVRLGHAALSAGDVPRAAAFYRTASEGGNPAASAVARYMQGWIRYQGGDAAGALRHLGYPLADPSFSCGDPLPFEQDVLSLSIRAWREAPLENLASYLPVDRGSCAGRRLLVSLGEAEAGRGEMLRASVVHDLLARRFPKDEATLSYDVKAIEELVHAGREDEAMSRALALPKKYGAGSAWADSQHPPMLDKAAADLAALMKTLSDRKFAEGIRSGDRSAMALAVAGFEQYFDVRGEEPTGSDGEMRLKWAIASLRTGDRDTGVSLLEELLGEGREDAVGERAAILYAETMIAGYERREKPAEDAEGAALLLLGDYPSDKAASLAFRAASAFLGAEDYERAARTAGEVESCSAAPRELQAQARLIVAEASVFRDDAASARGKTDQLLGDPGAPADPALLKRARELYMLSTLKEVDAKTASKDWLGAAALLEQLGGRFQDIPDEMMYDLRALRFYHQGGDAAGAIRVGLLILQKFPRREEVVEVIGIVGPYLEGRKELVKAADLYSRVAETFPRDSMSPQFLFHAARLSAENGQADVARSRFFAYRSRYPKPRWMSAYATLMIGSIRSKEGDAKAAVRELEAGLHQVDAGLEPDAPGELFEMAGKARITIGENWVEQFRKTRLVMPLEKSLAIKERFFRRALAEFEKAEADAPLDVAIDASRLSGDLFLEFGKDILDSQRPRGMKEPERAQYEEALKNRARALFERALERYDEAFDRLEAEEGPPDLAVPIRRRLDEIQALLAGVPAKAEGGKSP